jgi:7,8-dihydropterin-6-yl-methyl-4-(beta-D-ribofuranosyl)aminobenzene 5'-phosphate synthase
MAGDLSGSFYRRDTTLAPEERYYDGSPPEVMCFGSTWAAAQFQLVNQTLRLARAFV